ncbi:peptidylprolyl isomerase [Pseudomonas fluvialis]|jgi:peptidyl-prolyl cis-trans isomerase C|uniref:peptidylprolyl isomerase n=1 Tax=Pseudomonas fluvialis TaxID=1793966 RepID=A0ABQ2AMC5_9PSED|nr:peptidylprolyl isomerase [Pseudomonas fluvialis]OXM41382.1 peptidylprolyl isomerase [Pseudomonas fluvialis]GGH92729.1 peptidylprolyl isomerase [Pseudomonas fluvialis]
MACGCGGGNGGGCSGEQNDSGVIQQAVAEEVRAAAVEFVDAAPELIASSEQEWPRIKVNGVALEAESIARELQYHPAPNRQEAVFLACQALVIRELLQQRIQALGLQVTPHAGEPAEEAAIRALIECEVPLPVADEAACQQFFERNRQRYASAPLLAARHILLACPADDADERDAMRAQAEQLVSQLQQPGADFAALAMAHSACPSKAQGGALGQISKGQTVPEFERQLFRLPLGLASQPLESRYGFHVVWVDQRIEGQLLPYEAVEGSIRAELNQRVWQVAVAQYLKGLVGEADIQGIILDGAESPLVQ